MTSGPQRRPNLYRYSEGSGGFHQIPFSSDESWNSYAAERIAARGQANVAGSQARAHIETGAAFTTAGENVDWTAYHANKDKAFSAHTKGYEQAMRTLNPHITQKIYVDPEEYQAKAEHSTDMEAVGARTMRQMWRIKEEESRESKDWGGHGAGLYDLVASGEAIRNPARAIVGHGGSYSITQWQGHHRVAATAAVQRDTGVPRMMPIELHSTVWSAGAADRIAERHEAKQEEADRAARHQDRLNRIRKIAAAPAPQSTPTEAKAKNTLGRDIAKLLRPAHADTGGTRTTNRGMFIPRRRQGGANA